MRTFFAFDTETWPISATEKLPDLACFSWAAQGSSGLVDASRAEPILRALLENPDVQLVGHSVAFDFGVCLRKFPHLVTPIFQAYEDGRITCTKTRQKLIDLSRGEMDNHKRPRPDRVDDNGNYVRKGKAYSLQALSMRHFGKKLDKHSWRMGYGQLALSTPFDQWPEGAKHYAIEDATIALDLALRQSKDVGGDFFVSPDEQQAARHDFWMTLMGAWGFATDKDRVARLAKGIEEEIEDIRRELYDARILRAKVKKRPDELSTDTKLVKELIEKAYAAKGEPPPRTSPENYSEKNKAKYPNGQTCMDSAACAASGNELLIKYAKFDKLQGILDKDIPMLAPGVVHASFNSLLENGRTSSSKDEHGGGGNTQNPSRKGGIRECYIPRPGCCLVDSDYEILELHTLSQACIWLFGYSNIANTLNSGQDPHLMVAAQMASCSYEDALRRKKALDNYEAAKSRGERVECPAEAYDIGEKRQLSKPCNYGWPGGMGPRSFIDYAATQGVYVNSEQALELRRVWRSTWPEFVSKYFVIHAGLTANGPCTLEAFVSRRVRGNCDYTTACNNRFSALANDLAKDAAWQITRRCYDPSLHSVLLGSHMVGFPHDQVLVESPLGVAHECAQEVRKLMTGVTSKYTPDVPLKTTPCLADCFSKHAKTIVGSDGRLQVWHYQEAA